MSGAHVVLVEDEDTGETGVSVTSVLVNGVDVGRLAAVVSRGTQSCSELSTR
jgi:hypothetical protein